MRMGCVGGPSWKCCASKGGGTSSSSHRQGMPSPPCRRSHERNDTTPLSAAVGVNARRSYATDTSRSDSVLAASPPSSPPKSLLLLPPPLLLLDAGGGCLRAKLYPLARRLRDWP